MRCGHTEINFPSLGQGEDIGTIWNDPIAGVDYIWDGVKWDVYKDLDDEQNHWVRDEFKQLLTPRDPDDSIRTSGYQFNWLKNLREAPAPGGKR